MHVKKAELQSEQKQYVRLGIRICIIGHTDFEVLTTRKPV